MTVCPGADLHLPLTLITGVRGAGRTRGKRRRLSRKAAENVVAAAVLRVGERQQGALDLRDLRGDGAAVLRRFGGVVGLEGEVAKTL